jgi:hypothetical protein
VQLGGQQDVLLGRNRAPLFSVDAPILVPRLVPHAGAGRAGKKFHPE